MQIITGLRLAMDLQLMKLWDDRISKNIIFLISLFYLFIVIYISLESLRNKYNYLFFITTKIFFFLKSTSISIKTENHQETKTVWKFWYFNMGVGRQFSIFVVKLYFARYSEQFWSIYHIFIERALRIKTI